MQYYIDPVLVNIGALEIRYYGLVYAFAVLIMYLVLSRHHSELKLTKDQCSEVILWVGVGMMVFGRIFHFLFNDPAMFVTRPLELFMIQNGGMSFFGSFFGISLALWLYVRKHKCNFFTLGDLGVLVVSGALIFGRLANFINQELVGRVTQVPWCVNFVDFPASAEYGRIVYEVACRHPYQLYAALSHAVLFGVLFYLYKTRKMPDAKYFAGKMFSVFLIGYPTLRFITDFWRADSIVLLGLTSWQLVSLVVIIVGIYVYQLAKKIDSSKKNVQTFGKVTDISQSQKSQGSNDRQSAKKKRNSRKSKGKKRSR